MTSDTPVSELDRIEKMFSHAMAIILLVSGITVGGGAIAFLGGYHYVNKLVESAEHRVNKVAENAESQIAESASEVRRSLRAEIEQEIDLSGLVAEIKDQQVPELRNALEVHLNEEKAKLSQQLLDVSHEVALLHSKSDEYKAIFDNLVEAQNIAETMDVKIYHVDLEPDFAEVGKAAQLTASITAPGLADKSRMKVNCVFEAFGTIHKVSQEMLGRNSLNISIPFTIPTEHATTEAAIGAGRHAIVFRVLSTDDELVLAQESRTVEVRDYR